MPRLITIKRWTPTKPISSAGDDEDVQREEARQRLAGDDRAAEEDLDELQAHQRDAPGDRRADAESPVRILIPAQDLAGESHAQRHQQEKDAASHVSSRGYL